MVLAAYLETVHLSLQVLVQTRVIEGVLFSTLGTFLFATGEKTTTTRVAEMVTAECQVGLCERIYTDGTEKVITRLDH